MMNEGSNLLLKHCAKFQTYSTPFYFYDLDLLEATLKELIRTSGTIHIHYALKANAHPEILRFIASYGVGADCVSGGEIERAVQCGFSPQKIVFAGVAKTDREILTGLKYKIFSFNVESIPELEVLGQLATREGVDISVAFRLNPNVDPHTHKYITTGLEENKFGLHPHELTHALEIAERFPRLKPEGLHFHIGSQITSLQPFHNLCLKIQEINSFFFERKIPIRYINAGGGLGVDYRNPDKHAVADFESFFGLLRRELHLYPGQELHVEPGRSVVGPCGSLITRVIYVKKGIQKKFLMVDAGMSELIRPALYQAYHTIQNLSVPGCQKQELYDVVGPICESSDCFGKLMELPESQRGHILAIRTVGAYGESMASDYNLRYKNPSLFYWSSHPERYYQA